MRLTTAMSNLDFVGSDGGRLAMAFAAGCIATFSFILAIGGFIWKTIGGERKDRIAELKVDLDKERQACREMEVRLVKRIEQLETIVILKAAAGLGGAGHQVIEVTHSERFESGPDNSKD